MLPVRPLVLALLFLLPACSTAPTIVPDSGAETDAPAAVDAPIATDAPADARVRADAPDAAPEGDAGEASVAWITEVEPVTIDSDIALDYFYQYEVVLTGDVLAYALTLERCVHIAGMTETCTSGPADPLTSPAGVRWGIDPSMYAVGENRYRFTLTLDRDGVVVDTAVLELVATVTSCTACVGS